MSELQGLQTRIDDIRGAGGEVLAISSDPPDKGELMAARFPGLHLLHDPDVAVARLYGVVDEGGMAPVETPIARPASFLVDRDGVVAWRDLTDNWRVRPRAEDVLARLRELP